MTDITEELKRLIQRGDEIDAEMEKVFARMKDGEQSEETIEEAMELFMEGLDNAYAQKQLAKHLPKNGKAQ